MELENLIASLMLIVAVTPFVAVVISKITEAKRYKNLYGYNVKG